VQLAAVCIDHAGDPYHPPAFLCSSRMPPLHREPLGPIQTIRFRPAVAAIHLEARRVDHGGLYAMAD
jgi:hypothetical protein